MRYSAKFVKSFFKVINMKKIVGANMVNPPKRLKINVKQLQRNKIPKTVNHIENHELITLFPAIATNQHVLYLHGGGYALEASPFHKEIQERFVNKYNLKVSYFNYPLAPENTASQTLDATIEAFKRLRHLYPDDHFYVFGDSAGGGLAMSLAQQLRNTQESHRPKKLALISPWLDASVSDPRSDPLQEKDVLLEKDLLIKAGENYAGDLSLTDPKVSPIFGNFDDLGELLVIAGTDEILYPDVLRLQDTIAESHGTQLQVHIEPEMMHDFVVYPLKESEAYVELIGAFFSDR